MSDEYTKIMVQTETTKEDVKTSYDWKVIVGSVSGIVILLVILNRIPKYVVVIKRKMSKKKKITPFDKDLESENSALCDTNSQLGMSFYRRIENFKNGIPKYKMTHARRGLAIVFNHENFNNNAQRNGTNIDKESIKVIDYYKFVLSLVLIG